MAGEVPPPLPGRMPVLPAIRWLTSPANFRWPAGPLRFSLRPEGRGWGFEAVFELDGCELPAEALVFVEAYRQTTWMRWAWGTVGALQPPANRALAEFDSPDDVLFRVRVTSPGTPEEPHGLLPAEADRVRLRSPEELTTRARRCCP